MKKIIYVLANLFLLSLSFSGFSQIKTYRHLPVFALSPYYKVEVKQGNGAYQEIFTYQIPQNSGGHVTKNDQFANFGFEPSSGAVQIRVTRKDGTQMTAANSGLKNKTYTTVSSSFSGGALIINCPDVKKHLYVSSNDLVAYPLMIFVDPYNDTSYPATAKVKIFEAKNTPHIQTAQYDRYTVPNDIDVVVIEDGAVVQGTIHTASGRTKPLLVTGRGVILGNGEVLHGAANIPYNALVITKGVKHRVENIMVINSRHFTIDVGDQATLDNAKMYGYDANNDGVVGGDDCIIENVFSKINDDHIKLYNDRMKVRNCTFWMQQNGGLFQLAWNSITPGSNCVVENCEVIAWEAKCGDPRLNQGGAARTFINLRSTDAKPTSSNNIFRNIYVQGQMDRFLGINGKYQGSQSVTLNNYTLENITIEKKPSRYSWIYTGDSPFKVEFNFKNVKVAGQCMTAANHEMVKEGNVILNYMACGGSTDTQAPTTPLNLTSSNISQNGVTLSWTASTDNVAVTGYDVFINDVLETTVTGTQAQITDLQCNTLHQIKVRAKDGSDNFSAFSNTISFTTSACTSNGPSDITNLAASTPLCKKVNLSWGDVSGETQYRVRRKTATTAYIIVADLNANTSSFIDSNVTEGTSYTYMVRPMVNGVATNISNEASATPTVCQQPIILPNNSFSNISVNEELTGVVSIEVFAFDGNYGTQHGDGIQQVNYQIYSKSNLNTPIKNFTVADEPFYLMLDTKDYPDGDYQLRSGAFSLDVNEKKWVTVDVKIKNNITALENSREQFAVLYPNPFNETLNITLKNQTETNWKLYNIYGELMLSGDGTAKIETSSLGSGIYVFEIGNQRNLVTKE